MNYPKPRKIESKERYGDSLAETCLVYTKGEEQRFPLQRPKAFLQLTNAKHINAQFTYTTLCLKKIFTLKNALNTTYLYKNNKPIKLI